MAAERFVSAGKFKCFLHLQANPLVKYPPSIEIEFPFNKKVEAESIIFIKITVCCITICQVAFISENNSFVKFA